MTTVSTSRFWHPLWRRYPHAPSIALCRIPELEYAARLTPTGPMLDHCCGDGYFASLAWPGYTLDAGCDLNTASIGTATKTGIYQRCDACDASRKMPYADASFDLVFNNSALEHIPDVDAALREVARVLKPTGTFAFNVLNHRYFEWWPMGSQAAQDYREWQPFYHAWPIDEWDSHLQSAGLRVADVAGYFDREASQDLALLDYEFSGYFLKNHKSKLVSTYRWTRPFSTWQWKKRLGQHAWQTPPDRGAGYFIIANRV